MTKRIIALLVALAWICAGLGALAEVDINDEDTNFRMAEAWKNTIDALIADCVCPAGIDYSSPDSHAAALAEVAERDASYWESNGFTGVDYDFELPAGEATFYLSLHQNKSDDGSHDIDSISFASYCSYASEIADELNFDSLRYYSILPQHLPLGERFYEEFCAQYGVTQEMIDWYRAAPAELWTRGHVSWSYDDVDYDI